MKSLLIYLILAVSLLWFSGCYTIVDMGQPLSDNQLQELEEDYQEEDNVYSFYSERFYGGYNGYHALPWWYNITPVTVNAGGYPESDDQEMVVTRKRDRDIQSLRDRDGGRNSAGTSSGSSSSRGSAGSSGNSSSGSSTTSAPATKSPASNDSGGRSSGSEDNKNNSGRSSTGGGRK